MKLPRIFTIAGVAISFADLSQVRPLGWCQWVQAAAGQRAMGRTRTSSLTFMRPWFAGTAGARP